MSVRRNPLFSNYSLSFIITNERPINQSKFFIFEKFEIESVFYTQKYRSVFQNSFVIQSFSLYGDSLYRMPFAWKTMGVKSGPGAFIRYKENSLYRVQLYGESPVVILQQSSFLNQQYFRKINTEFSVFSTNSEN